jgi:hypothetical protein
MPLDFIPDNLGAGPSWRNTRNISLVKKKAFSGEKGLDTISPIW